MSGRYPAAGPDWRSLRTLIGPADFVPGAIDRLLCASTAAEATQAYWELDNRVVVQGQLFEAAEQVSRELVRRICAGEASPSGLPGALDLLVELAYGESDASEIEAGNPDLGRRCRAQIADGLECMQAMVPVSEERARLAVRDLVDRMAVDG